MNEHQTPQSSGPDSRRPESAQSAAPGGQAYGPGPQGPTQGPYYAPYIKPSRLPYAFTPCDAAYACFTLALGFLCWELRLFTNLGGFVTICVALAGTAMYFHARGVRQTVRSLTVFIVCVLGALPLLLYDSTPIFSLLIAFTLSACFYWIAVSTGNSVEKRVSGFVLTDWWNQTFIVPFSNYLGLFVSIRSASKDTKRGKSVLIGVIGLCIAIPLIIGVTSLLVRSDANFEHFTNTLSAQIGLSDIGRYALDFIIGIPIACYIFGSVCGNLQKRYTANMTKEGAEKTLAAVHRIPRAAIIAPLAALSALYIIYIAVMGTYLFSAFAGVLPSGFNYSEYARQGFFDLCGVASINLVILAFTYSFARRGVSEYPKALRVLTGLLSVMTELLVVTAVSKMLFYIDAYGLSRLRVYTLWFLVLLFVVFAILIAWHVRPYIRVRAPKNHAADGPGNDVATGGKPFNAGRPIVIVAVCFMLALFLANTDGIIAKYNVWQYESGASKTVDTDMLATMSDAVLPYLADLAKNAPDESVSTDATNALASIRALKIASTDTLDLGLLENYRAWNIQSAMYVKYLDVQPSDDQTLRSDDQTAQGNDQVERSDDQTTQSGDQATQSSDQTAQSGDQTEQSGDQTAQSDDQNR